jgi:hypothetical protein
LLVVVVVLLLSALLGLALSEPWLFTPAFMRALMPAELGPPIAPALTFAPAPPPAWPGPASAGPAKAIAAVVTDAIKIFRIMTISPQFRQIVGNVLNVILPAVFRPFICGPY